MIVSRSAIQEAASPPGNHSPHNLSKTKVCMGSVGEGMKSSISEKHLAFSSFACTANNAEAHRAHPRMLSFSVGREPQVELFHFVWSVPGMVTPACLTPRFQTMLIQCPASKWRTHSCVPYRDFLDTHLNPQHRSLRIGVFGEIFSAGARYPAGRKIRTRPIGFCSIGDRPATKRELPGEPLLSHSCPERTSLWTN